MTALFCWMLCSLGQVEPVPFVVHTIHGAQPPTTLVALKDDWSVKTDKAEVAGKELVSLRHAVLPLPPLIDQSFLWLNSGERLPLQGRDAWRLDQDRLHFHAGTPLHSKAELSLSVNYAAI